MHVRVEPDLWVWVGQERAGSDALGRDFVLGVGGMEEFLVVSVSSCLAVAVIGCFEF